MSVADFSGYASKNDLLCSDGRTIKEGAFKENDRKKVPLVYAHSHNESTDVLGHCILENRKDGVYAYGYFNDTQKGRDAKIAVQHGDIDALSIFANNLVHSGRNVVHGNIREVSLVLAGANPGAFIDNVTLQHGDGEVVELDDQAQIYMEDGAADLQLVHSEPLVEEKKAEAVVETTTTTNEPETQTPAEVLESMSERQQALVHTLLSEALATDPGDDALAHAANSGGATVADDATVEDVINSMTEVQQNVLYAMLAEVAENPDIKHSNLEGNNMNSFEQFGAAAAQHQEKKTLSHDALKTLVADANSKFSGSLKDSFLSHAETEDLGYGIQDIDILFPDAKTLSNQPDFLSRRNEWVADVLGNTKHSPFSRIKSIVADITADEARAKGYVKGNLKKEEIIKLLKRVTTPTTIYKKQKLDRDDIVDITDLDVVAWIKAEMRVMLDEEIARAVLIGDGREADDEDKIDEDHVRPIATDADMYAEKVEVDSNLDPEGFVKAFIRSRSKFKGTGTPTLYTSDPVLTDMLLVEDKVGRRKYESIEQLAAALRVKNIVVVEVLESQPELIGIVVNLADYTIGADAGGTLAMFDDFDIDYNQYKYLIESRLSGALTKPKSAVVLRRKASQVVTPTQPTYNATTHTLTFPQTAGVSYYIDGDRVTTTTVVIDETTEVEASPSTGYAFPSNSTRDWVFSY